MKVRRFDPLGERMYCFVACCLQRFVPPRFLPETSCFTSLRKIRFAMQTMLFITSLLLDILQKGAKAHLMVLPGRMAITRSGWLS